MNGTTHLIGGIAALVVADKTGHIDAGAAHYALCAVGSIFPDLDAGASMFTRPTSWLPFGLGKKLSSHVVDGAAGFAGKVTKKVLGHRGLLHRPVFYIVTTALLTARGINHPLLKAFFIGIGAHLALDWLTKRSIPLLWPLPLNIALPKLLRVRTNSWAEHIVTIWLLIGLVAAWRGL